MSDLKIMMMKIDIMSNLDVKTTCEIMQEDGMVNIWFLKGEKILGGYILPPKALLEALQDSGKYICGCCGDHTSNVTWNEDLERDECNNCLVDNLKGE